MASTRDFQLRPFQKLVLQHVLNGRSVILQAPTGSGKTKAALAPFLQNLAKQGDKLPHTCRYAVPMRVLANQFYHEFQSTAEDIDKLAPTRLVDMYRKIGREAIAVQTGEQPEDTQLESALTFCTIDQLLASFLAVPYGMGPRLANLNVGGVAGSYLILDEFHLYPLLREGKSAFGARTTAIQMLRLFKSITPFVLMTATFSTSLLDKLKVLLDAEVVTVSDEQELQDIAQGRGRVFQRSLEPMNAEVILAEHNQRERNKCTLVVCNTVLRAQELFLQLQRAKSPSTRVVLLHSRFSVADRRRLSEEVEQELGPQNWQNGTYIGKDILVIATQVVEVGLDISVEVLHTENVPANSLIQRAGRCARFAHQQGKVIIYPLPLTEEGKEASTLPYDRDQCLATWNALEQFDGQTVGFPKEQILINEVHTAEDLKMLQQYDQNEGEILKHIFESFNTNQRSVSSTLIRDVSQVQILIHDDPATAIQEAPWQWQSFSMHPGSLASAKRWEALQERGKDLDWVCKEAEPFLEDAPVDGADGIDNRQKTSYKWKTVANREAVRQALVIALPSQLARYDSELGFVLLDGTLPDDVKPNGYQSVPLSPSSLDYGNMGSRQTSYQGHISGLVQAYNVGISREISYVSHRLEKEMGLPTGMVDQAIRLAIACHDLGKLNRTWQQWALAWQKLLWVQQGRAISYQLPDAGFCFAKTDHNYSREQRKLQNQVQPKRPNHACESVAVGRRLIAASLGITKNSGKEYLPVLRAICGAIARHHTSQASSYGVVTLNEYAKQSAAEALHIAHQNGTWSYDIAQLSPSIEKGDDLAPVTAPTPKLTRPEWECGRAGELETWLYFVIVRALRLADQRAG